MAEIVEFPVDKLIAPGLFQVKANTGTVVYIYTKGIIVEGIVEGYFGHITPDKNLSRYGVEGGAKPAAVSQVGYAVSYFVPNPQYPGSFVKQSQLVDEDELFLSLQEVYDYIMEKAFLRIPNEFRPKEDAEEKTDD